MVEHHWFEEAIKKQLLRTLRPEQEKAYFGDPIELEKFMTNGRNTGRTYLQAVYTIIWCLDYPGEWIEIKDHHSWRAADMNLLRQISGLLGGMRIYFEMQLSPLRLRYKGLTAHQVYEFEEVTDESHRSVELYA
jgi:hypothetical protein